MESPLYRELKVWQKAHDLTLNIIALVRDIPDRPAFRTIIQQIVGSASSIGANIAEGSSSRAGKEYIRYLQIALRSATELDNWIQLFKDSEDLRKYYNTEKLNLIERANIEVLKMLTKMIQSLQKKREEEDFGSTIRDIVEEYLP
jgi:four helix bundle protein